MRRHYYGANAIPEMSSKSFLQLCWDAIQDETLIILLIAAVISIIFGLTLSKEKDVRAHFLECISTSVPRASDVH
jgi:hypothetical protein